MNHFRKLFQDSHPCGIVACFAEAKYWSTLLISAWSAGLQHPLAHTFYINSMYSWLTYTELQTTIGKSGQTFKKKKCEKFQPRTFFSPRNIIPPIHYWETSLHKQLAVCEASGTIKHAWFLHQWRWEMRILRCQVEHGESMVKFMGNPQMSVPNIELIWLMFVIQHTFLIPYKLPRSTHSVTI